MQPLVTDIRIEDWQVIQTFDLSRYMNKKWHKTL